MNNAAAAPAPATIAAARLLADDEDFYEMDACPDSYASCANEACVHRILIRAAEKASAA